MAKIHRFQLEGKLQVASIALGLTSKALFAAVEPLLDIQEPRLYELKISARDFRVLPGAIAPAGATPGRCRTSCGTRDSTPGRQSSATTVSGRMC